MTESPRIRRLKSDSRTLEALAGESSIFQFTAYGSPPETYLLKFHGRGLFKPEGSPGVAFRDTHEVLVQLGASYPRMMPDLTWKTPIFHPNISASGHVCLGGYGTHWVPSVTLDTLCRMLWDMIRYANYDVMSPYNREAAQWVKTQNEYIFPLDGRPLKNLTAAIAKANPIRRDEPHPAPPAARPAPARELPLNAIVLPSPAPLIEPEEGELIFLDDVIERPAQPAAARENDILFIS